MGIKECMILIAVLVYAYAQDDANLGSAVRQEPSKQTEPADADEEILVTIPPLGAKRTENPDAISTAPANESHPSDSSEEVTVLVTILPPAESNSDGESTAAGESSPASQSHASGSSQASESHATELNTDSKTSPASESHASESSAASAASESSAASSASTEDATHFTTSAPVSPSRALGGSALNLVIGTSPEHAKLVAEGFDANQLPLLVDTKNDLAHRLIKECPPTNCTGIDCAFAFVNGCKVCVCPIGSPARGCDKLPDTIWNDLMTNGCPNEFNPNGARIPAKKVIRWYRYSDSDLGISQCRYYIFPYCSDTDFNFWHSPRTKSECRQYCFRRGQEVESNTEVPLKK